MQIKASKTLVLARVLLAMIFVAAGVDKVMHYAATQIYMSSMGVSPWLLPLVIALEVGAGACLMMGVQTKLVSLLLAGFTLLASAIFHHTFQDQIQLTMFMKNLAIAGGLLAMSLDRSAHSQ